MRKTILYPAILLSLSSCATIFNKDYVTFKVNVDKNADVSYAKKYDGTQYDLHSLPDTTNKGSRKEIYLTAKRNKNEKVAIVVKKDGVEDTVNVKPIHSNMFYWNAYPFYGLGCLVDLFSERRFTYPRLVYITSASERGYTIHLPYEQHKLELYFNPLVGNVYSTKFNYVGPSVNPWGLVAGLNYHVTPNRYLSVEIGGCFGLDLHLRRRGYWHDSLVYDSLGTFRNTALESKSDVYLNLAQNHVVGRFDFGYGINIGDHNSCRYYSRSIMGDTVIYRASYMSLGFVASAHYRLSNDWYFGVSYMPQLLAIGDNTRVIYEHALNFGFSFRVGADKKKK
jgi:hypothetical protein